MRTTLFFSAAVRRHLNIQSASWRSHVALLSTNAQRDRHCWLGITSSSAARDTFHAVVGAVTWVALDACVKHVLALRNSLFPSSVATILMVGSLCIHPRTGAAVHRVLGPGAAVLRGVLPLCLGVGVLAPLHHEFPSSWSVAAKYAVFGLVEMVSTVVAVGWSMRVLLARLGPCGGIAALTEEQWAARATARKASMLDRTDVASRGVAKLSRSPKFAVTFAVCGTVASYFVGTHVPVHVGCAGALFVLCNRYLPASLTLRFPPMILCGLGTGLGLALVGGQAEVDRFIDHTIPFCFSLVPAAMGTLGLLVHSQRELLRAVWKPLVACCCLTAPVCMVLTAAAGSALNVPRHVVVSAIPATTTLGLAMAMSPALQPLGLDPDFMICGPIAFGLCGMLAWSPVLQICGLRWASPVVTGFAVGGVSHVSGMTALASSGMPLAADAAAIGFFSLGVARCLCLEIPCVKAAISCFSTVNECD